MPRRLSSQLVNPKKPRLTQLQQSLTKQQPIVGFASGGSVSVGPGGRTFAQITGTSYLSEAERQWYLNQLAAQGTQLGADAAAFRDTANTKSLEAMNKGLGLLGAAGNAVSQAMAPPQPTINDVAKDVASTIQGATQGAFGLAKAAPLAQAMTTPAPDAMIESPTGETRPTENLRERGVASGAISGDYSSIAQGLSRPDVLALLAAGMFAPTVAGAAGFGAKSAAGFAAPRLTQSLLGLDKLPGEELGGLARDNVPGLGGESLARALEFVLDPTNLAAMGAGGARNLIAELVGRGSLSARGLAGASAAAGVGSALGEKSGLPYGDIIGALLGGGVGANPLGAARGVQRGVEAAGDALQRGMGATGLVPPAGLGAGLPGRVTLLENLQAIKNAVPPDHPAAKVIDDLYTKTRNPSEKDLQATLAKAEEALGVPTKTPRVTPKTPRVETPPPETTPPVVDEAVSPQAPAAPDPATLRQRNSRRATPPVVRQGTPEEIGFQPDPNQVQTPLAAPNLPPTSPPGVTRLAIKPEALSPIDEGLAASRGGMQVSDPSGARILGPNEQPGPGEQLYFHGSGTGIQGDIQPGLNVTTNEGDAAVFEKVSRALTKPPVNDVPATSPQNLDNTVEEPLNSIISRSSRLNRNQLRRVAENRNIDLGDAESRDEILQVLREEAARQSSQMSPAQVNAIQQNLNRAIRAPGSPEEIRGMADEVVTAFSADPDKVSKNALLDAWQALDATTGGTGSDAGRRRQARLTKAAIASNINNKLNPPKPVEQAVQEQAVIQPAPLEQAIDVESRRPVWDVVNGTSDTPEHVPFWQKEHEVGFNSVEEALEASRANRARLRERDVSAKNRSRVARDARDESRLAMQEANPPTKADTSPTSAVDEADAFRENQEVFKPEDIETDLTSRRERVQNEITVKREQDRAAEVVRVRTMSNEEWIREKNRRRDLLRSVSADLGKDATSNQRRDALKLQNDLDRYWRALDKEADRESLTGLENSLRGAEQGSLFGGSPSASGGARPPTDNRSQGTLGGLWEPGTPGLTAWDHFKDAANAPRSFLASFDFSYPLRQGFLMMRHFNDWKEAAYTGFRALWDDDLARQVQAQIEATHSHLNTLHISSLDPNARLNAREEQFISRWVGKIPGIRRSQQGATVFINKLRADVFDSTVKMWDQTKQSYTTKDLDALGNYINRATGWGNLGNAEALVGELGTVLFSPRLLVSRIQAPGYMLTGGGSNLVRKEAIKDFVTVFGATGSLIYLAQEIADQAGFEMDVNLDPRSSDFGKIKMGETRMDLWGGYQQFARLAATLYTGERLTQGEAIQSVDPVDAVIRFFASKAAPGTGVLMDFATGTNYVGEEVNFAPENLQRTLYERVTPLFIQDLLDAISEGSVVGAVATLPSFFGTAAYTIPTDERQAVLNNLVSRIETEPIIGTILQNPTDGSLITNYGDLDSWQRDQLTRNYPEFADAIQLESKGSEWKEKGDARVAELETAAETYRKTGDIDQYNATLANIGRKYAEEYAILDANSGYKDSGTEWQKKVNGFWDEYGAMVDPELKAEAIEEFTASLNPAELERFDSMTLSADEPLAESIKQSRRYIDENFWGMRDEQYIKILSTLPPESPAKLYPTWSDLVQAATDPSFEDAMAKGLYKEFSTQMIKYNDYLRFKDPELDAMLYINGYRTNVVSPAAKEFADQWIADNGVNRVSPRIKE